MLPSYPSKINTNLEALRGFSAFFVVIYHIILARYLDYKYFPEPLKGFAPPGYFFVFVFFVLSGYVIGISTKKRLTLETTKAYLKKRFVRLYPIYFISIAFAFLVSGFCYPWLTVFSHFTMLQGLLTPVINENSPAWSLHFEVLFYLLFIPISLFDIKPWKIFVLSTILAFINSFLFPNPNTEMISAYLFGFAFWISGLCLAVYYKSNPTTENFSVLISIIFLLLSVSTLIYDSGLVDTTFSFVKRLSVNNIQLSTWGVKPVTGDYLFLLPFAIAFVMIFAGIRLKYPKTLYWTLQIVVLGLIVLNLKNHTKGFGLYINIGYFLISLVLLITRFEWVNNVCKRIIGLGTWLGSISYGLYIIHFPILMLFFKIHVFSGSMATFAIRFAIYLSFTLLISYLLERKLQPWIKQRLMSSKTNSS